MVFLSVSLAVFNLLPIPVLDGGHLMFFLAEAVKGKPVSLRVMEVATQVGMALILALTVLAVGNDVLRLFNGG
jgi:regulator of sigma E protease